jgi:hypothetical protein
MALKIFQHRYGRNQNSFGGAGSGQGRNAGQGGGRGYGGGRGGGTKPGSGPGGNCVCPSCGHTVPHIAGKRCVDQICPKCGSKMVRE